MGLKSGRTDTGAAQLRSIRQYWRSALQALFLAALVQPAAAQTAQTGTITGLVRDGRTLGPLSSVQISVMQSGIGTLSQATGRYVLPNVPAGARVVRVERLGYKLETRNVQVSAGQSVTLDLDLTEDVLALDGIVVTGTAGGTQRRAIGNVVATLPADVIVARSPVRSVDQLLGQRTPGLIMLPSTGSVGSGSAVRIRGVASMSLETDPIVYIDGVRMDSDPRSGPTQRGGANQSRLNDINPADIQSIEVIKGPAAATLYGTEASNGVIQIITKRGISGKPQFDASFRTGLNWLWNPGNRAGLKWMRLGTGELVGINIYEYQKENGFPDPYGYGRLQNFSISARGGTEAITYFASAAYDDDVGVVPYNWYKRIATRLNLETTLAPSVTLRAGGSYVIGKNRLAEGGGLQTNTFHNLNQGDARNTVDNRRGYRYFPMEELEKIESRSDVARSTLNLELVHRPTSWFMQRVAGGLDANAYDMWMLTPMQPEGASGFFGNAGLGTKTATRGERRFVTVDYSGAASFNWRNYSSQSSVGFQYYRNEDASIRADGSQFPAVPVTSISGGAVQASGEGFTANSTVGVYVQEQIGWNNRVFVTGAVRGDDNSAFGADYDAAIYPKLSATWVLSEEPFWSFAFINQLRFRSAWGTAGRQPATFAANRLYSPVVGFGNAPALVPSAVGNAALKPERGEELELGFDADLFAGRLNVVYTRYQKRIRDAIVERALAPSTGFTGSQIVNLGLIHASGNELGVNARIVDGRRFAWAVEAQVATFGNEIKSMGGVPSTAHRRGYSIADVFLRRILSAEINSAGNPINAMCDGGAGPDGYSVGGAPVPCAQAPELYYGHSQPTWQIGIGSTFTFFQNLSLTARVEGNGGHVQNDTGVGSNHSSGRSEPELRRDDPIYLALRAFGGGRLGTYEAGFLRLREVSAAYDLPARFAEKLGTRRLSVNVGMRNLTMLWTKQHGWSTPRDGSLNMIGGLKVWDPEIRATGATATNYQTVLPPTASFTVTLRAAF